jgi:hypothetical protein
VINPAAQVGPSERIISIPQSLFPHSFVAHWFELHLAA